MARRDSGSTSRQRAARAAARPKPGSPRPYRFPRFERRRLPNGVELVVASVPKLPIATAIALVDAGAVCDPAGREGIAQLTADLLLEGTEQLDAVALIERFERLGASIETAVDWDGATFALTALTENLAPAFRLLGEVLCRPAFPEREVQRLKAERQAELLQQRAEPRGLADEMFSRFLYEPPSRYALPAGGTEQSVARITRDQVLEFYRSRYAPGTLTIVVAGDIDAGAAEALTSEVFGNWAGDKPAPVTTSARPARTQRAMHLVAKPDAPQAELRIGNVGVPRSAPDYYDVVVMNAVLGGLFSSRINLNLREEHGYTYGAFSTFDWRRQAGPFVISTAVQSDVTGAAATEALREVERMRAQEISSDELSLATSYLDGVFPIRYETTEAIATALSVLVRYGLADDFYDTYRDRVRAVTVEGVLRAAQAHLHVDAMQLVVVGDEGAVRAQLESLDAGPLMVYDTEGNPI